MTLSGEYPISLLCRLLDLLRSSFYYRRLTAQLRREGPVVNGKRVRRLVCQMGLQRRQTTPSRFLDEVYTHKRIRSSLGYLTLAEFGNQWLAQQAATPVVI